MNHTGARLADVSAVLRHYKFTRAFARQTRAAVREGQNYARSADFRRWVRERPARPGEARVG